MKEFYEENVESIFSFVYYLKSKWKKLNKTELGSIRALLFCLCCNGRFLNWGCGYATMLDIAYGCSCEGLQNSYVGAAIPMLRSLEAMMHHIFGFLLP